MRDHDFEGLKRGGAELVIGPGESVLIEGEVPEALYLVESGTLVVRQAGHIVALIGPGEVIGELAFLGQHPATASVESETDVVLQRLSRAALDDLLEDDPDLAARFYRGIAEDLADRLRTTTRSLSRLRGELRDGPLQRRRTPTGRFSQRSEPAGLSRALDRERNRALNAARSLDAGDLSVDKAAEQVGAACDAMLAVLAENLDPDAVLTAGASDPMAFRDSSDLRDGVSGLVLRETFPVLMSSHTLAQCFARPRGYPEDYLTTQMLYDKTPSGDGMLGPLVDDWFKRSTFVSARREARTVLTSILGDVLSMSEPQSVCGLGTGAAVELIEAARSSQVPHTMTAIDLDPEALQFVSHRLSRVAPASAVRVVAADVSDLAERSDLDLTPQTVVYASGLAEYLDDPDVEALLAWGRRNASSTGSLLLACLRPSETDLLMLRDLLGWHLASRDADEWRKLGLRAGYQAPPRVEEHVGWQLVTFQPGED